MSKESPSGAKPTSDVFSVNYVNVTSGNNKYHCNSPADKNAKANENSWQVVKEDLTTGDMANLIDPNGKCNPDYWTKISDTTGLAGVAAYLDTLNYWTP